MSLIASIKAPSSAFTVITWQAGSGDLVKAVAAITTACIRVPRGQCTACLILGGKSKAMPGGTIQRSEEHTSELQSLMRISYAVFCLTQKKKQNYSKLEKE